MRTMDKRCQQFTASDIAEEMLDLLGYQEDLYGKKLLENSCGEGNILCLVVERYIKCSLEEGHTKESIVLGLESDIFGAEIVETTYYKCLENLDNVAQRYGLEKIKWNIFLGDVLTCPFEEEFDYVIGNPPYISYRNLEKEVREYIKKEYSTCKNGKPDYCYAFIENALQYLAPDGKMVYLIPNSIYKNVYAQDLRDLILDYVEEIRDYPNKKLFDNAMTSSAIMFLRKGQYVPELEYNNIPKKERVIINKENLSGKWVFKEQNQTYQKVRFDDSFKASMAVATQRNQVFVIDEGTKIRIGLERGAIRSAVSPRNQKYGNKEYIIFPYMIRKNKVLNYTEEKFKSKYPKAYAYLCENKEELKQRDADKSAQWFEFGRSQALQNMNKKKLLVSTVVTDEVNVYDIGVKAIPYAGIYIISSQGHDLKIAKRILESEQFLKYIRGIGTPASGKSLRITAKDINEFKFRKEDFFGWEK